MNVPSKLLSLTASLPPSSTTNAGVNPKDYANRAGVLSCAQVPLIIALAGKNNLISLLTGIDTAALNLIHRSASRVALILAWAHTWGRYSAGLSGKTAIYQSYMIWGCMSLAAFTILSL